MCVCGYQEKHSLLQAFPRQFAETAQPDELLRRTEQKEGTWISLSEAGQLKVLPMLSTHPAGDDEIVDAYQIFLQLQKLLEVLHLD